VAKFRNPLQENPLTRDNRDGLSAGDHFRLCRQ